MQVIHQSKKRQYLLLFALLALFIVSLFVCIIWGSVEIELQEVLEILFTSADPKTFDHGVIIWNIRLPRVIATAIGGAALAISGLLLQIFFKNPIVEPYVLGISSGATLFVALIMLGGVTFGQEYLSPYLIFWAALVGALIVTMIIVLLASRVKTVTTLLVAGIMIGYIYSALTNLLTTFADREKLFNFTIWTMGSFSGFTWKNVRILLILTLPTLAATFLIVKPLNAFLMGEEYAKSMGVNIRGFRIVVVVLSSVLVASITAFAGPVAFIGLAVPHLSRLLLKTTDNKILIPATMLLGGIVTSLCDLLCRTLFSPIELPISAITSIFGAPLVISLILKQKKGVWS